MQTPPVIAFRFDIYVINSEERKMAEIGQCECGQYANVCNDCLKKEATNDSKPLSELTVKYMKHLDNLVINEGSEDLIKLCDAIINDLDGFNGKINKLIVGYERATDNETVAYYQQFIDDLKGLRDL